MTNIKSNHNGYYNIPVQQLKLITCNDFLNISSTVSNFKKQFPCNIFLILLIIIQISSTCLMLISIAFSFKMISAENQFINQSSKVIKNFILNSGNNQTTNIESSGDIFRKFLLRFRSLSSENQPDNYLITDRINSICENPYIINKFRGLTKVKLKYCDMFDVSSVIYSLLIDQSSMVDFMSNITFQLPDFEIDHKIFHKIPKLLLFFKENGHVFRSIKSTHKIIDDHFSSDKSCKKVLTELMELDKTIENHVISFSKTLLKNHCELGNENRTSSVIFCKDCKAAYKKWLCTHHFDIFIPVSLPNSEQVSVEIKNSITHSLIGIKSCPDWCSKVETDCPFFTPFLGNGGEPAFLCDESHYHHNARYRLYDNSKCGIDMPFRYCCYSEGLLQVILTNGSNEMSSMLPIQSSDSCVIKHRECLQKTFEIFNKRSINNSVRNDNNNSSNSYAVSIFELNRYQLKLIICITSSFFLYFYTDFSIR